VKVFTVLTDVVCYCRKHLVYEQRLHEQYGSLPSAPSISPDTMSKSHTRSDDFTLRSSFVINLCVAAIVVYLVL